jgi:hypothetical protein
MMKSHVSRTFIFSLTAFFMVLQFQNCAPVQKTTRAQESNEVDDFPVHSIGDYSSPGALTFPSQKLEVSKEADSASVSAQCSSSIANAMLQWRLLDPSGGPNILEGFAECINGQLDIDISPAQMLSCNLSYELAIATSAQSAQAISLSRNCN